ncbi:MAG: hypothetical protein ACEY3A_04110, partial [Wolbachia sp.]
MYNKRCLSRNTKLRHYHAVIRPETLYISEFLILNRKCLNEKLEDERKILRKIMGPVKMDGEYRRRYNQELYNYTKKITDQEETFDLLWRHFKDDF